MSGLQKAWYWIKGWYSCLAWIPGAIFRKVQTMLKRKPNND